jgi:PBP1b-binding outer membrane lipoprotein LpoB
MKKYFLTVLVLLFLASCSNLSKEAEKRLDELKNKTESLDYLINK